MDSGRPGNRLLAGLIGTGIAGSLTPALQEEEAFRQGLRLHYQPIDLDRIDGGADALPDLIRAARMFGFCGLNITYPVKQLVLPLLDELSDDAREIGAVNTVVNRRGRLIGYNTDASGWRWGFEQSLPAADLSTVVLIGAGGAGSAIAQALMQMGTGRLLIHDQLSDRAHDLASRMAMRYPDRRVEPVDDIARALAGAAGLVHATQTGMRRFPGMPVDAALLRADLWVAEAIYFPLLTDLLIAARRAGCPVVDGGSMAVGQALGAFEHFTGLKANPDRMRAHFARLTTNAPAD